MTDEEMTQEKAALLESIGCTKPWSTTYVLSAVQQLSGMTNRTVKRDDIGRTIGEAIIYNGNAYIINGDATDGHSFYELDGVVSKLIKEGNTVLNRLSEYELERIKRIWCFLNALPVYCLRKNPDSSSFSSDKYTVVFDREAVLKLTELKTSQKESPPDEQLKSRVSAVEETLSSILSGVSSLGTKIDRLSGIIDSRMADLEAVIQTRNEATTRAKKPDAQKEAFTEEMVPYRMRETFRLLEKGVDMPSDIRKELVKKGIDVTSQTVQNYKRKIKELKEKYA